MKYHKRCANKFRMKGNECFCKAYDDIWLLALKHFYSSFVESCMTTQYTTFWSGIEYLPSFIHLKLYLKSWILTTNIYGKVNVSTEHAERWILKDSLIERAIQWIFTYNYLLKLCALLVSISIVPCLIFFVICYITLAYYKDIYL